jgi:hypothetical protein
MNLKDKTLHLLKNRPRTLTLAQIEDDTGIGEAWLKRFSSERSIQDPSVNTIETLYNYLSDEKLKA